MTLPSSTSPLLVEFFEIDVLLEQNGELAHAGKLTSTARGIFRDYVLKRQSPVTLKICTGSRWS
jgi:hypothetical protein